MADKEVAVQQDRVQPVRNGGPPQGGQHANNTTIRWEYPNDQHDARSTEDVDDSNMDELMAYREKWRMKHRQKKQEARQAREAEMADQESTEEPGAGAKPTDSR